MDVHVNQRFLGQYFSDCARMTSLTRKFWRIDLTQASCGLGGVLFHTKYGVIFSVRFRNIRQHRLNFEKTWNWEIFHPASTQLHLLKFSDSVSITLYKTEKRAHQKAWNKSEINQLLCSKQKCVHRIAVAWFRFIKLNIRKTCTSNLNFSCWKGKKKCNNRKKRRRRKRRKRIRSELKHKFNTSFFNLRLLGREPGFKFHWPPFSHSVYFFVSAGWMLLW